MKTKKKFRVGVVGTDSLRGREIKSILSVKKFPLTNIEFFDPDVEAEYSKLTEFQDEPKVIHHLAPKSLEGLDLVFLAADNETNRACGRLAREMNFQAIDLGEAFSGQEDVPLIVAGVNDGIVARERFPVIANPHPATIVLSSLLHCLIGKFGVAKTVAFILQPVSAFDESGIEELASQSAALLSSASLKKNVFKEQIAFNILSHTEALGADGFSSGEKLVIAEVKRVLSRPDFPISLTIIQAPVFHTYSIMAYIELASEAEVRDLESVYKESPFFKISSSSGSCYVSCISVAGKEQIFIGQIKKEEVFPNAFWIWTVTDNLTRGSALNALEIAKIIFASKAQESASL
jgi:aspartate-semialdehyde dehydrogenase